MPSDLILQGRNTLRKEARALALYAESLGSPFEDACQRLYDCRGSAIVTGMGKSGLVGRKWASTFASTGTKAFFLNPAEAQHGDLGRLHSDDVLIALSFSGETTELTPVLRHANALSIPALFITGNTQSTLAQKSQTVLIVPVEEEACPLNLAPTTSTTLMMALGDALAVTLMQMRQFTEKDFARLHPGGSLGKRLWLSVEALMHQGDQIPKVTLDQDFKAILVEMTQKRLGATLVVDNGDSQQVRGIITDGDLRRHFQKGTDPMNGKARDIMTPNPKEIPPTALATHARQILDRHSIHHLVVVDESKNCIGVLHSDELLRNGVV